MKKKQNKKKNESVQTIGMKVMLYPSKSQIDMFERAFMERNWWYNIHLDWYMGRYKPQSMKFRAWLRENPNCTEEEKRAIVSSIEWPSTNKMGWPQNVVHPKESFKARYGEASFIEFNQMNEAAEDDLGRAIATTRDKWKLKHASNRKTHTFCVPIQKDRKTGTCRIGMRGKLRKIRIPFMSPDARKKNPELEWVRCSGSWSQFERSIEQKAVTVTRDKLGKYWASIRITVRKEEHEPCGLECGIDVGCRTNATVAVAEAGSADAHGDTYIELKQDMDFMRRVDKLKRALNRKKSRIVAAWLRKERPEGVSFHAKGNKNAMKFYARHKSKAFKDTERMIARLYDACSRRKKDFIEKASHTVSKFDAVGVESLNVSGMMKNHRLARTIAEASMSELLRRIKQKSERIVEADRFYASSKTCALCGGHYADLGSKEIWTCPHCGSVRPRDRNAASNLRPSMMAGKPAGQSAEERRHTQSCPLNRDAGTCRKPRKGKDVQKHGRHGRSTDTDFWKSVGLSGVGCALFDSARQLSLFE